MISSPKATAHKSTRRRRVLLASLIVVIIAIGPALGFYLTFVKPSQEWFVRVNGEPLSRGILVEMLRAEQIEAALRGQRFVLTERASGVAARLTQDEVLHQQTEVLGIQPPTETEVDRQVADLIGVVGADGSIDQRNFGETLRQYLDQRRLSESLLRRQAEADLMRETATAVLAESIEPVQPQVHVHRIVVRDEASAEFVFERLQAGAPFDQMAAEYSIVDDGDDFGWRPYDGLPPHVADFLWNVEPLEVSLPVPEPDGTFALYVVSERDPARELSDDGRAAVESQVFDKWINEQFASQDIEVRLGSEMIDWLREELAKTRLPGT